MLLIPKRQYQPLNLIEISASKLIHNYQVLSSLQPTIKIAPVLKSNAYGHGLVLTAKILEPLNPPFFCVDSLFEAYELFKAGITTKILIMGYVSPISLQTKKLPFAYAVFDLTTAKAVNQYQPGASIHLFIDTGMRREGILTEKLPELLTKLQKLTNIKVEGIMSHLGQTNNPNHPQTKRQINEFNHAIDLVTKAGFKPIYRHVLASSGLLNLQGVGNVARVGLALYGFGHRQLKPVLTLTSRTAQIKEIPAGSSIGYSFTYKTKKKIKLGILPVGYQDGVDLRLSNQGLVQYQGKNCPIIGRVSMNITAIDLSSVSNPIDNEPVTIFSDNPADKNSIIHTAELCQTIPYEILVHLNPSTRRVVV